MGGWHLYVSKWKRDTAAFYRDYEEQYLKKMALEQAQLAEAADE